MAVSEFEKFLRGFPGMSAKTIVAIVEHVEGMEREGDIWVAEVNHARVPVQTVRVYGLEISLDANGNAVSVEFPHGAVVPE